MPWTNASIVLNSRDATAGSYNALKFNAQNQNIIQGQVHSIAVSEVNFPYDIPNVQKGPTYPGTTSGIYNTIELSSLGGTGVVLTVSVTPGFYTATELETALNKDISGQAIAAGLTADDAPTFQYEESTNRFTFFAPTNGPPGNVHDTWDLSSPYTFPPGDGQSNKLGKDLLSIMGFQPAPNGAYVPTLVSSDPASEVPSYLDATQSAPIIFTQYKDICSPLLCQYQYFRDGSTTNLARRSDVVCRLYIANNVATLENEGTRPFIINRQFFNARVMRWSAESSVGQMDINLFDDCGQPLLTTWDPRPYQITFNCYEQDKDSTTY